MKIIRRVATLFSSGCIALVSFFLVACGGNSVPGSIPASSVSSLNSSSVSSTTPLDATPNPFTFNDVFETSLGTDYISNKITLTGINTAISLNISNGEYSLNRGAFTNGVVQAVNGDTIELRAKTSSAYGETHKVSLQAGTLSVNWLIKNISKPWGVVTSRSLVDSFDSLDGWSPTSGTAAGSQTVLLNQGPNGEDVLRITVTSANALRYISKKIIPTDYNKGWFGQWVRFPDLTLSNQLGHLFYRDPGAAASNGYYQRFWMANKQIAESVVESGDWHFTMWQGGEMPSGAKQSDGTAMPTFDANSVWFNKLVIGNQSVGGNASVDYGPMYANIRQDKPRLLIGFDDSNITDYTVAYPYLKQKGIKATTYTIPSMVGSPSGMTLNQLHEMQVSGWSIASHGDYSFTTLTHDEMVADITNTKMWLINNGFSGWPHMAYPLGDFTPATIATLKEVGFRSGRTVISRHYPLIPERGLFHLGGTASTSWKTAADGIAQIDLAIASGGTMNMFTHRLDETVGGHVHTNVNIWKQVIDYAAQKRDAGELDIITIEELEALTNKQ